MENPYWPNKGLTDAEIVICNVDHLINKGITAAQFKAFCEHWDKIAKRVTEELMIHEGIL